MSLETAMRPQMNAKNANGLACYLLPSGHPRGASGAGPKSLTICVHWRSFAARLLFLG